MKVGQFELEVRHVLTEVAELLREKNAAYGDSALNPLRVLSIADADEQILVRMDDKLSRISRGLASGEDAEWDLLGYAVLYGVYAMRTEGLARPTFSRDVAVVVGYAERVIIDAGSHVEAFSAAAFMHECRTRAEDKVARKVERLVDLLVRARIAALRAAHERALAGAP